MRLLPSICCGPIRRSKSVTYPSETHTQSHFPYSCEAYIDVRRARKTDSFNCQIRQLTNFLPNFGTKSVPTMGPLQLVTPGGVLFCSNPRGEGQEGWNGERYGAFHDWQSWRNYVTSAGFMELTHYYRPVGLPREQQPWLALTFGLIASCLAGGNAAQAVFRDATPISKYSLSDGR